MQDSAVTLHTVTQCLEVLRIEFTARPISYISGRSEN